MVVRLVMGNLYIFWQHEIPSYDTVLVKRLCIVLYCFIAVTWQVIFLHMMFGPRTIILTCWPLKSAWTSSRNTSLVFPWLILLVIMPQRPSIGEAYWFLTYYYYCFILFIYLYFFYIFFIATHCFSLFIYCGLSNYSFSFLHLLLSLLLIVNILNVPSLYFA